MIKSYLSLDFHQVDMKSSAHISYYEYHFESDFEDRTLRKEIRDLVLRIKYLITYIQEVQHWDGTLLAFSCAIRFLSL